MNPEQMIPVGAVELCVQTVGDPGDSAVLLIHGACASMVWWEDELCERIAVGGRFVIRYDPSVTFMSTTTDDDGLPSPTREFSAAMDLPDPDLDDEDAVVEYLARAVMAYHGSSPLADEEHVRALARLDVARSRDLAAAMGNHFAMEFDGPRGGWFGDVTCPALVIHGALDPAFPLEHGHALHAALPGSTLVVLDDTGHELPVARWDDFVDALLLHTAPRGATRETQA